MAEVDSVVVEVASAVAGLASLEAVATAVAIVVGAVAALPPTKEFGVLDFSASSSSCQSVHIISRRYT